MASNGLEEPLVKGPSAGSPSMAASASREHLRARLLLAYCTVLQLLIYIDRGIIAGFINFAQAEFGINHFEGGLLGTIFLAGFMLMSPVAAACAGQGRRALQVIGLGLGVWAVSMLACGMASTYGMLLAGRAMAGCGEAALVSLAPPLIDDAAPPGQKSAYLAVFFSSIFFGLGVGFVIAGHVSCWADGQVLFLIESAVMAPLCIVAVFCGPCLLPAKDPSRGIEGDLGLGAGPEELNDEAEGAEPSEGHERRRMLERKCEKKGSKGSWQESMSKTGLMRSSTSPLHASQAGGLRGVLCCPVYTLLVLGYCATIFTMGGIAFWGPTYLQKVLDAGPKEGDSLLGAITGLTGILGTTLGGVLLDFMDRHYGRRRLQAAWLCAVLAALSCPLTIATVAAGSKTVFFVSLALGQLLIFAATAPANIAMMEAVKPEQRGLALGLCTLASHALGDLIPPVLVGYIADVTGSLTPGMWLLVLWLLWSALFWSLAFLKTYREDVKDKTLTREQRAVSDMPS